MICGSAWWFTETWVEVCSDAADKNDYEAAAGVWLAPPALAAQDVDLLWDARKQVQFPADDDDLFVVRARRATVSADPRSCAR